MVPLAPVPAVTLAPTFPSRLQIALALAILKTRPNDLTPRNYLLQLRAYLRHGRQHFSEEERHRYLDSLTYWKQQYETSEDKCHELERRNAQLEQELETLRVQPTKRTGEASKSGRTIKKPKRQGEVIENPSTGAKNILAGDADVLKRLGEAGATLAHTIYTSYKLYEQLNPDLEAVCANLGQLARAIASVVSVVARNHDHLSYVHWSAPFDKGQSEVSLAMRACAKAFTLLLVGLGKVPNDSTDRRLSNILVYEVVKMFQTILENIMEAARLTITTRFAPQKKAKTSSSHAKAPASTKESNPPQHLAQLINALVSKLDRNDPTQREMFEGYTFVLLERVGKRLYYCTFGRDRSATIQGDIAIPPNHDHPAAVARREKEMQTARLEVRSLAIILERAVGLAPYYMKDWPSSASSASSRKGAGLAKSLTMKNPPPASRVPLNVQAKDRLSRTLISCMFGLEGHNDLSDILRMPARLGALPTVAKAADDDVDDWFTAEVWRLVGWEMLGRDDQL
ncbi:hypothetical protein K504DRAFT_377943 [Pleomassaria siparia CBS 279.74]|uniref:Uncharacterized protein n=1 Tax=Pleomassaria siparia CBS 279.74 TaxID=1314801 RepID=A0A6G1KBI2_9PLEO|nr:hypothetical protein K504DRAFT_377943 [Pleomassaria siparia CBS 279.74]